jgi:murein DD-endopeptidase MepM/ murein hydrolase activator NlpD
MLKFRHSGKFSFRPAFAGRKKTYPESRLFFLVKKLNGMPAFAGITMVLSVALIFSACSFGHPQVPSRDSIVPGQTITVEGNKSVYAVAREHNVSMREIIVLNNLQPPFTLRPGQTLTLPASAGSGAAGYNASSERGLAPAPYSAPSPAIEAVPLTPIQAVPPSAQPKPTSQNGILGAPVTSAPVEDLNKPILPKVTATTVASAPVAAVPTPPPAPTPVPQVATAASTPAPVPPPALATAPTTTSSIEMKWPVQGPVLSTFGPKGQGLNNDGVNIGAPKGAPVVAAANGIVVYAGNEMKGFGNLVLIRHTGGWVTAYAHLDRTLVNKDAVVAQGDMIGTVGKTGNVPSPQLHFETRLEGKPVDPATVIKAQ